MSAERYHCRGFQSCRDVSEAGSRAVLPRTVVLVPVAEATGHCCHHSNVGQEEDKDEEELHLYREPRRQSPVSA